MRQLVFLHLIACLIYPVGRAVADTRQICIASGNADAGTTVTVPITLHEGNDVAGFQVDVRYEPTLLSFSGSRVGADTQEAGNWSVLDAPQAEDVIRILGVSGAGVGLSPGVKEIALIDFNVMAPGEISNVPFPLMQCILSDELGLAIACEPCLQPGTEAAFPRFRELVADDDFLFVPDPALVETGDWVLWHNQGSVLSHTTTSGTSCLADGLWDESLSPGQQYGRRFTEGVGSFFYFCTPHCESGHVGEVVVTAPIFLTVTGGTGAANLSWAGGSGQYRVFRSPNPLFVGGGQLELIPEGGASGTTLADADLLAPGEFSFYLVSNP